MKNISFEKLSLIALTIMSLVILILGAFFQPKYNFAEVSGSSVSNSAPPSSKSSKPSSKELSVPMDNCEIRTWYNFQVVAIPKLNEYWIEQGISLEERAKKAFILRHDARKNARYMMANQAEVEILRQRDIDKYGNPDGPTLEHLVQQGRNAGKSDTEIYEGIIASSSRTNNTYNIKCD